MALAVWAISVFAPLVVLVYSVLVAAASCSKVVCTLTSASCIALTCLSCRLHLRSHHDLTFLPQPSQRSSGSLALKTSVSLKLSRTRSRVAKWKQLSHHHQYHHPYVKRPYTLPPCFSMSFFTRCVEHVVQRQLRPLVDFNESLAEHGQTRSLFPRTRC